MNLKVSKKIKKIIVHIGPPKTGTTSFQRNLFVNRDLLLKGHILYPSISANHRFIVSCFMTNPEKFDYNRASRALSVEAIKERNSKNLSQLIAEIERHDVETLVLSSEHLGLLDGEEVIALKEFLFGISEEVSVVAYLRHPVSAVASHVQTNVKSGARTIEECEVRPPFTRFASLLPKWVMAFGKRNIVLREFDSAEFKSNDLVADFMGIIGADSLTNSLSRLPRTNESLSHLAVLLVNELNKVYPKYSPQRAKNLWMLNIKGPKYAVSQQMVEKVAMLAEPHLEYLTAEFDIRIKRPSVIADDADVFSSEALLSVVMLTNNLSKQTC